jgi:hypothetical protein
LVSANFFFNGVFSVFAGVFEKTGGKTWFLVVNLWWDRGDLW